MTSNHVSFDKQESFMKDVFIKAGVPEQDAAVCAEILIESDKRGIDSHGLGMVVARNSTQPLPRV